MVYLKFPSVCDGYGCPADLDGDVLPLEYLKTMTRNLPWTSDEEWCFACGNNSTDFCKLQFLREKHIVENMENQFDGRTMATPSGCEGGSSGGIVGPVLGGIVLGTVLYVVMETLVKRAKGRRRDVIQKAVFESDTVIFQRRSSTRNTLLLGEFEDDVQTDRWGSVFV